ncbi:MAG: [acyl-carrier-protein] S-malonyltransferase [Gemmatimonadetes bacterium]|nr:MAG: [acyl-carrier-protein] S-malonyltransferase [Gemmatimonadota bacterium]PYP53510.1 MAG: [acyl-carrier-protein] S-malonyltransferase [Gemmatimonadota bacterium]
MDIVLLFPGQGSQKPGMGKDLADAFPIARGVFGEVDAALGADLSRLCFEGPADELTLTRNAQPALFAHGAAVWALTRDALRPHVRAAAGHSLGEFTAYHAADAVSLPGAARLVRRRGELMFETGTSRPGTMAAILGTTSTPIEEICERATRDSGLVVPANFNTDEQVVISGEIAGVERAMDLARDAGAKRAIKLPVSGAFHSPLMEPAVVGLTDAIATSAFTDPVYPVYSNVTALPSTTAVEGKDLLLRQLTSPVRWSAEIRNIAKKFADALYVEMGPGNVLSGLMGRLVKGARTFTCGTAAEVEKLLQMAAQ